MALTRSLLAAACLLAVLVCSGCATPRPKPKTVGQVVGEGVDASVSWASDALFSFLKGR